MAAVVPPQVSERHLCLPGTYNVRDVGGYAAAPGYATRWRTLYRGDALHRLDDEGRRQLRQIGLRTLIDLRGDDEVLRAPNLTGALEIETVRHPIFARRALTNEIERERPSLEEIYLVVVTERSEVLVGAVRELARTDALPAMVHCTIGKDRTGMVISLVLSLLGVDDDVIAADYAETSRHLVGDFHDELVADHTRRGYDPERVEAMLEVDPSAILAFLDHLRALYGSTVDYLSRHGMTDEEMSGLFTRLAVPRDDALRAALDWRDGPEASS